MFNRIKRLYKSTENKTIVANAVKKGWITEADYEAIVGEPFPAE